MTLATADSLARDTLNAILSGALTLADSTHHSGDLHLMLPSQPAPGWFERWGIAALVNVVAVGSLGWFVKTRLQNEQLGHQAILALFTHRAGTLSQVQLRATRRIWKSATRSALALRRLGLPLRSIPANDPATYLRLLRTPPEQLADGLVQADQEEARKLHADNHDAAVHLEEERAFLPIEVYNLAADYFAAVSNAASLVSGRAEGEKDPKKELAVLLRDQVFPLYERLDAEIRGLTTPQLPAARV